MTSAPPAIVIRSSDTDVMVFAVYFQKLINCPFIMQRHGKKKLWKFVDIGAICAKLGNALSAALPGFCAFYGCDTTSGFPVKGKKTFFKELVRNDRFHHAMSELGESTTIDTELYKKCEEAIYNIY